MPKLRFNRITLILIGILAVLSPLTIRTAHAVAAAATVRDRAQATFHAACLRSKINPAADQRRSLCICLAERLAAHPKLSDAEFTYLARSWENPKRQARPEPADPDRIFELGEEATARCVEDLARLPGSTKKPATKD